VKLHVSTGTGIKEVSVVSVIGQSEANAKKTLEGLGLKVNVAYEEDSSKDNGVVLKQSLDTGKVVDEGTTITITVNKLAEMKQGTVKVNLKSLLNYTPEKDEDGKEVVHMIPRTVEKPVIQEYDFYEVNPNYDPDRPYIPRSDRPEWDAVGMLGVLAVRDDGACQVNGYCNVSDEGIATASDTGWRVIARVAENIVKVVFR